MAMITRFKTAAGATRSPVGISGRTAGLQIIPVCTVNAHSQDGAWATPSSRSGPAPPRASMNTFDEDGMAAPPQERPQRPARSDGPGGGRGSSAGRARQLQGDSAGAGRSDRGSGGQGEAPLLQGETRPFRARLLERDDRVLRVQPAQVDGEGEQKDRRAPQRREGGVAEEGGRQPYSRDGGRDQEGFGGYRDGEQEKKSWNGPRQGMSQAAFDQRRVVNDAINMAETWEQLAGVMADKGSSMDAENIAIVLRKVSKLPRPVDPTAAAGYDGLLSALLGWVLALLPTFRPKQTCGCLVALGRLGLYNKEVVEALVEKCTQQLGNFEDFELGLMLSAFKQLGHQPSETFWAQYWAFSPRLAKMNGADLVSALQHVLEHPGMAPPEQWMSAWSDAMMKYTNLMWQDYCAGIVALGTMAKDLGYQPSQALIDALFSNQIGRLERMKRDQLSQLLWALSNFQARASRPWFEGIYKSLESSDKFWTKEMISSCATYLGRYLQQPATPEFTDKLMRWIPKNISELDGEALVPLVYLLAVSDAKPADRWLDDVVIKIKAELPLCTVSSLEMVYNGLPMLGSGYRLNEVVTDAANRYNAAMAGMAPPELAAEEAA
eukprot:CAMPEP_0119107956 /NCGR_PEP_ID=MMETSP1180-20130426/12616_1 /TAXON_ID=3052 ORGANISM="Chlamydomonas cf sp, Strain CCMP681" /NCGR_SAMPLE_ID=MMETSP1180 /ASSEMBLY_ACC=CAM_ASM_000741 /LENGTH=606 /DNA_ID=CAMNT_0007093509 /DNA_START=71 /DNA_END=1894 /DNA_ORIENTATION=+